MKYYYVATKEDGSMVEGNTEAQDLNEVLQFLSELKLKPVNVKKLGGAGKNGLGIFAQKINLTDLVFFSKYLSLMLKIGTGLLQALDVLIEDFKKPAMREFLMETRANLERGLPFATTFERYPTIFSQVYINLVKAGEASGNLEKIFDNLTTSLTKEKAIRDQVKSALVYPIMLLAVSLFVLVFLVIFVLPKVSGVFMSSGFEPPLFSRIVFSVGMFFGKFGLLMLIALAGVVAGLVVFYKRNIFVRRFITNLVNDIPVVKDIVKKIAIQRFASTLSALIRAGLPLTKSLEITAQASGKQDMRDALLRVSTEGLAKGLTLGESFKREKYFPRTVTSLMAISERAGHVEEVLSTLADFYTTEIDSSLKTLVSFLEPVMLLGIGAIIGLIALSIIVPIYQFTTQF